MSMNIDSTSPISTPPVTAATALTATTAAGSTSAAAAAQEAAVSVEVGNVSAPAAADGSDVPASPPQSVLQAISVASDAYDKLTAAGKQVSFSTDPETGAFTTTLTHADGSTESLTGADALAIASGEDY